jgi:uncharacterized protein
MPWTLRTLLNITLAAAPLALYLGLRCAASAGLLRPAWKATARRLALLLLAWFLALPAYTLVVWQLGRTARHFTLRTDLTWADYLLHYPFWFGVVVVIELTVPYLLLDLGQLVLRFFSAARERGRKIFAAIRVGLALFVLVYVPVRAVLDTTVVRDTVAEVQVSKLPPDLDGLKVTLVSDIQVDRYTGEGKVDQARRIVKERDPEILLSAGDLVTSGTAFLDAAASAVGGLSGSALTAAVMGDHDHWSAPGAIRALHERAGWTFLDDRHHLVTVRGRAVLLTGLTYIYSRRKTDEELNRFLGAAPRADLRLLLVHQPAEAVVKAAARYGYHVVLAGHTHGGQIVGHPLGFPVTPSRFETRYYSGVSRVGATAVVVTDGVGLTLAPIRYHAPAEVTTVVLRR